MKNLFQISIIAFASILLFTACEEDKPDDIVVDTDATFNLDISGLEDLGSDYRYEGWLIVDGSPVSAGLFTVNGNGALSSTSFTVDADDLSNASTYVLTIEPNPDSDPSPSSVHILAGDISNNTSTLTVDHSAAIGTNFTTASGSYILATPTDGGADTNETSGVWWLDPAGGPAPTLDIPTLPDGWIYEGWAVIDGQPVSTGTFALNTGADNFDGFSGTESGPPFPGEDFLVNAPAGLEFPTNLQGATVVVSVEPVPDNSSAPFLLKPLVAQVADDAPDHTPIGMSNNATTTNPTGTFTIN